MHLIDGIAPTALAFSFDGAVSRADIAIVQDGGPSGAPLQVVQAISGTVVSIALTGGTEGGRYNITIRGAAASGESEQDFDVTVLPKSWAMPDGSAGWIDLIAFVARMGFDEAVAASDADGSGQIDRKWLIAKLIDAQAEVEANIAGRYMLPLSEIPAILQSAVADLARARLYRREVPEAVAEAVKSQRRLLERIAKGDLRLALPSGASAGPAPTDAPVMGWSNGRAYPDNLTGY